MSQIEELQSRITAAMERISAGVVNLSVPQVVEQDGENEDLASALEDEKIANAQLEERLKSLKAKHAEEIEALSTNGPDSGGSEEVAGLQSELAAAKAELEELRARGDGSAETDSLKSELAEATAKLMAAEAAKSELAEAKAMLEANDESVLLSAEIEALKAQLDAVEDVEPLKAELEELRARPDNGEEMQRLRTEAAALKAELNNTENMDALKSELEMLRAERVSHGESMARLDDDLQRLRKANDQLREVNTALREANEAGVGEPHLINKAMLSELEALRAARATDAAEVHAVLSKLEPMLAQANLAEGEDE